MIVKELIEHLQKMEQDLEVVIEDLNGLWWDVSETLVAIRPYRGEPNGSIVVISDKNINRV